MKRLSNVARLVLTGLIIALALFTSFGTARAASGDGDPYKTQGDLIQARKWQLSYQEAVQDRLVKSDAYDAAVSAVIADLRAKGFDTSKLQEELTHFRYHITSVRGEWVEADAMLAEHKGYDANGQVVDKDTARATVYKVRECQRLMKGMGVDVYERMHHAFTDYGKLHPTANFVEPVRPTNKSLI